MDWKRLEEIEARAEKATKGPWEAQIPAMTGEWPKAKVRGLKIVGRLYGFAMVPTDDAEFVANSRQDIPWLCEQLREKAEKLAEYEQVQRDGYAPPPPDDVIWDLQHRISSMLKKPKEQLAEELNEPLCESRRPWREEEDDREDA